MILIKKQEEIEYLKRSGTILALILRELSKIARLGTTLQAINQKAIALCQTYNVHPAFLGYQPEGALRAYPAAVCTSLNEIVVHGIPTKQVLKKGDVLKIDMGVSYKGFITDAARTVAIPPISTQAKKIIRVTQEALQKAIRVAKKGKHIGAIGYEIERIAKKNTVHVLRELTGHGVGYELHEDPIVYNFGPKDAGVVLREGMVIAIEPMLSLGSEKVVQKSDESYASLDGSLTAHFEHTIAIHKGKTIVLTL